jgi:hypothetical protein
MHAKVEAVVEWVWDYFSEVKGDQVLDRFSREDIDWNSDQPAEPPPAAKPAAKS